MALSGEAKKEWNRQNYLDRKKERDIKASEREKERADKDDTEKVQNILNCTHNGVEASGPRYKSEALSETQLQALYEEFSFAVLNKPYEEWRDARDTQRKDLFHLGSVLGWTWYPHVHKATCDFFVQKNFDGVYYDGYILKDVHRAVEKQDRCHNRLLIDPRYHYKTTIDSVDALQWLLNGPDLRVFILTAEEENSDDFLKQIKGYLYKAKGASFTEFQAYWPEYILRGRDGASLQPFIVPARKHKQKDPSLWADSIMATLATQHCDIMKADDVVSNRNSGTPEMRVKLKNKFDQAQHLLDPWGFFDALGTRYAEDDWYASRLKASEDMKVKGYEHTLKTQVRAGWVVKDGETEQGVAWKDLPLRELELPMVDLLFPELKSTPEATFERFMIDLFNNEEDFRCQILNEPAHTKTEDAPYINLFTETNIRAVIKDISWAPKFYRDKAIFVDTALTDGRKSDYSAFAVAGIEDLSDGKTPLVWYPEVRAIHATDLVIAKTIVELMRKHDCRAYVEDLPVYKVGSTHGTFKDEVKRQLLLQQVAHDVIWFKSETSAAAKETRIRGLQLLHERGLLRFVSGEWIAQMIDQLVKYNGDKRYHSNSRAGRKDDIPDAMSYVYKILPYIEGVHTVEEKEEQEKRDLAMRMDALREHIFGSHVNSRPLNPEMMVEEPPLVSPIHSALNQLGQRRGPFIGFGNSSKKEGGEQF